MMMMMKYMTPNMTMKMMSEDTTEPIQNRRDGAADRLNIHMKSIEHRGQNYMVVYGIGAPAK